MTREPDFSPLWVCCLVGKGDEKQVIKHGALMELRSPDKGSMQACVQSARNSEKPYLEKGEFEMGLALTPQKVKLPRNPCL